METIKSNKANLDNKRFIFLEIGLLITLTIVFFAFNIKSYKKINVETLFSQQAEITEEIIPVTVQETKLPPPPTKQITKIRIVEDNIEVESDVEINVEADQATVMAEYIPYVPPVQKEEEEIKEEQVFVIVESMPSFPGGELELMKYLNSNLKYPTMAKEMGISGRVFLTFVVEKDGSVTDIQVLRGIGGGCDEEAIRVVKNMPKWIPGKQRNVPVRVRFNLPVKFTLL
ncbi:MAG TPA: TonB family protein [Bacteroidales bacterium]